MKVMPTRFADALGVRYEIKKEIKDDTKVYGLSNWKTWEAVLEQLCEAKIKSSF